MDDLLNRLRTIFVGAYVVEEELPGGGMSRLFRATDRALNRSVVIKILPPELTTEVMAARFKRESEVTAQLQHPHILPIITAGVNDGLMYYVMPFIAGESLRARITRRGRLPVDLSCSLLREVASALAYAHKEGVIHRDIKPENILLQEDHAVLADFGIAAALAGPAHKSGERLTRTGMSLGTVGYMAPEQTLGGPDVDSRADIYSLGVVGHEMIAGAPPFGGHSTQAIIAAHLTQKPPRLDDLSDEVPLPVARAIEKAMAKDPHDRYQTAGDFRDALDSPAPRFSTLSRAVSPRRLRRKSRKFILPVLALAATLGAVIFALTRSRSSVAEQPVTIVIAPFDALVPDSSELKLWHEGMVDLMARNLDGAGPLRTISPTTAIRGWKGLSDHQSALALARRTNARYAIFGNLGGSGIDSVRIRATLLDASKDQIVGEYEPRGADVDKAASALTIDILKDLRERHRIGAVRQSSIGSTSLLALKAFLQGEQYFRRTSWDSAGISYARAVSLDTTFALALRREAQVTGWQKNGSDSLANAYWLRAGSRNHGLGPRDSLLIASDSIIAALDQTDLTTPDWAKLRRLFSTVDEMSRRYPDDPEAWYAVGEARMHYGYGSAFDISERQVLEAFDRAIALDSAFSPAYIHTVQLAFTLDGAKAGRRYIGAYLAYNPTGKDRESIELLDRLTDPARAGSRSVQAILDTASTSVLFHAWIPISRWADTAETALRLLRAVARRPRSSPSYAADSAQLADALPHQLAYRGRMREALSLLGARPSSLYSQLALLGAADRDTAQAVFATWLKTGNARIHTALPWWASIGDTGSISRVLAMYQRELERASAAQRPLAKYNLEAAKAYLFLSRRDSASAKKAFVALSDSVCLRCDFDRLQSARFQAAMGRPAVADKLLRQRLYSPVTPTEIILAFARAQIAARAGREDIARSAAQTVVDAWKAGDPEVQAMVTAAKHLIK
ncbi:MAG: serine/threonine protein kinase [Gemmatimonadota bacterium]|nr:serine/threonine protein kinase [Gemmatimonadota bacterium]